MTETTPTVSFTSPYQDYQFCARLNNFGEIQESPGK